MKGEDTLGLTPSWLCLINKEANLICFFFCVCCKLYGHSPDYLVINSLLTLYLIFCLMSEKLSGVLLTSVVLTRCVSNSQPSYMESFSNLLKLS